MNDEALLRLDGVRIGYPSPGSVVIAVDHVDLALEAGAIGCLLGPSGCGKTSVLRAIAGFEPLRDGRIAIAGQPVAGPALALPPERRRVGMMFQDYALFPHLDVAGNVGFGLRGLARQARARRVDEVLALVGLQAHARRYPHELSGGQQQRVALARALAPSPALLLLDEPFSNLDVDTRQQLAAELRLLLKAAATTVLMVTHDQAEAFAMADRIGVMDRGRLLQWDGAEALYHRPVERFVAGFIGRGGLVPAALLGERGDGLVLLRPEHLQQDPAGPLQAELLSVVFRGPGYSGRLRLSDGAAEGADVEIDLGQASPPAAGTRLRLAWRDPAPVRFGSD